MGVVVGFLGCNLLPRPDHPDSFPPCSRGQVGADCLGSWAKTAADGPGTASLWAVPGASSCLPAARMDRGCPRPARWRAGDAGWIPAAGIAAQPADGRSPAPVDDDSPGFAGRRFCGPRCGVRSSPPCWPASPGLPPCAMTARAGDADPSWAPGRREEWEGVGEIRDEATRSRETDAKRPGVGCGRVRLRCCVGWTSTSLATVAVDGIAAAAAVAAAHPRELAGPKAVLVAGRLRVTEIGWPFRSRRPLPSCQPHDALNSAKGTHAHLMDCRTG